jgi:hypothetical protein
MSLRRRDRSDADRCTATIQIGKETVRCECGDGHSDILPHRSHMDHDDASVEIQWGTDEQQAMMEHVVGEGIRAHNTKAAILRSASGDHDGEPVMGGLGELLKSLAGEHGHAEEDCSKCEQTDCPGHPSKKGAPRDVTPRKGFKKIGGEGHG